jgi:hypothetical protein
MYRSGILGLTILAPRGAPCALEGERCSGYIGTPWPRRGPRRTKWLVSLAQPRGGCRCSLGSRTVVLVDLLEIYNDAFCSSCPWRRLWPSLACYHPFSATAAPQTEWRGGNHGSSAVLPGHVGFSRVPCSPAEYTNSRSSEAAATIFRNARMQSPLPYRHAAAHARRFRYHRCSR